MERVKRELGRAYRTKSLIYNEELGSGKVFYRQSDEPIVARSIGTT